MSIGNRPQPRRSRAAGPRPSAKSASERKPRRRRRREEAEREIIDAAEALLRERPFEEFTVDAVMFRTGLSRASFYNYFRDRSELMARLVEWLRGELDAAVDSWRKGGVGAEGRAALEGMADVYRRHGALLRALQSASHSDPEAERVYRWFMEAGVGPTAKRIRNGLREGRMLGGLDPEQTARALCALNDRLLLDSVGADPEADPTPVIDTLLTIWKRTLYGGGG